MKRFLVFMLFLVIATSVFGQERDSTTSLKDYFFRVTNSDDFESVRQEIGERAKEYGKTFDGGFPSTPDALQNSRKNNYSMQKMPLYTNGSLNELPLTALEGLVLLRDNPEILNGRNQTLVFTETKIATDNDYAHAAVMIKDGLIKCTWHRGRNSNENWGRFNFKEKETVKKRKKIISNTVQPNEEHGSHFLFGVNLYAKNLSFKNYDLRGSFRAGAVIYENLRVYAGGYWENKTKVNVPISLIQKGGHIGFEIADDMMRLGIITGAGFYEEIDGYYDSALYFKSVLYGDWIVMEEYASFGGELVVNTPKDRWSVCPPSTIYLQANFCPYVFESLENYSHSIYVGAEIATEPVINLEYFHIGLSFSNNLISKKDHIGKIQAGPVFLPEEKTGFSMGMDYNTGVK